MKRKKLISILLTTVIVANFITVRSKTVQAVENVNLALNKKVTASNFEVDSTSPQKAIDGNIKTRWGTEQNKAANEWIEINLEESKEIRQINISFERTDENQNILGYKVELENNGTYTEVYKKTEKAKQNEKIVFDEMKTASKVKITILDADGGTISWKNVGINEIEIYSDVVKEVESKENINHVLNSTMTASSVEENLDRLNAEKANDGSKDTRWASNYDSPSTQWIKSEFPKLTKVKQININLLNRDISPNDSNVEKLSIKYTDENGVEKYIKKDFENISLGSGRGWNTNITILLDEPIIAKDITICEFVANSTSYNNISITELEAYSNEQRQEVSLDSVVAGIVGQTIENNIEKLPMPSMPEGYTVKLNGADFEQIIGKDGTIVRPLVDKSVKVSFEVTEESTKKTKKTADLEFIIKGKNTQKEGMNSKPAVIPEIAEWYSDTTNTLKINSMNKVVYNDDSLEEIVDEFISDYENFTGIKLSKEKGSTKANSYNFIKEIPDTLLGDEGYTMDIQEDKVIVKSQSVIGNMYGMQTILQMYKQNESSFNIGTMRDYPRFEKRGFLFDVARKPVSIEMIKDVSRTMRYYKMNDLQVHLSDNYIFLEQYGKLENENEAFKAYEAFRLESGLTNDKGESPTAKDYWISKEEFNDFIVNERNVGMNIVPEIDVPAHATSFTKIWPELMVTNKVSMLNSNRPLVDHLDVSKKEAMDKIKEIFDDYTKGSNPTFDSQTTVHIGADEFLADYTAYRNFLNELVPHIKETNTVRMWGGLTWIDDNKTEINKEAIENVEMNLWSSDWADGLQMYNMGYKLINTIDDFGYMVPNGSMGRANAYGDLLNINRIFNEFEVNRVKTKSGYKYIPSGDDQMLGAAFAIWSDNIDKSASGLSESDLYWRFFDAMPFYAEKTWAATGKEKGSSEELSTLANEKGIGPNINPYYQEEKEGEVYESYDFEEGLEDTSTNDRDLIEGTAKVENGVLNLESKESYVTSPIDKLGNGNELSFDITLEKASKPGDILFEADAAYGTHDIRVMENGKLGFTRELYNYYFDYELPVGKTINIKIVAEQQKTKLYVNDEFICDAKGKYIHNDIVKKENITNATFALPLERIGSKTNSIQAVIDNVEIAESKEVEDIYHKENWSGETNTETIYNDTEGKLEYAFDNNENTIWHSNWQGATDKLNGTNSFYAELNLGKPYKINQFSFTPRLGNASGYVTKADLYIKTKESDEWKVVAENRIFEANADKKTFVFDEQEVQYIKFVAKESNDGWVAVSEFDIANKAEQTFTVHVDATKGGTVSGGKEAKQGEEVTVAAIPNKGYIFDGWYRSTGEKVSENDKYIFNVDGNISLTAHFIKDGEQEANKEELENLYNTNKDILEDKYTPESWLIFKNALDNAKLVLENEDATQEQVNEAISNLNEAISNLVYKSEASEVDKSKLQELINKAEEINTSNYTKESINIFNDKLKEGKDVLNNEKATQEEVDEAVKKLQFALDNLELIKDDQDTGNNGSENNSNGNNGSENNVNENDNGGKDNNSDNLPSTGGTSSVTVGVIALMITGTGIVLRRKR
ncbi:discoidin domain-containing protein [Clostridium sp.]|uniref:discoidin domain-containing protein n=1 Tax=Clostridium sp. TaxID=1506 RepID=UPI0028FE8F65|nr:discoidin domain-containing protein [Clostridium sp.]MDU2155570.1 discoidin domain-containing protein [Clostridium sp.]MDU6364271.1 discoidin domain-containing protein [Clostridium sp.]